MKKLTHFDQQGQLQMVNITGKEISCREAVAAGKIYLSAETIKMIKDNKLTKGDCLNTARLAGIMAAKNTASLIPLCHPLNLEHIEVAFEFKEDYIYIQAKVKIHARTGVEMEALTAVAVASLTIYDMCKAVDKDIIISEIKLLEKTKRHP